MTSPSIIYTKLNRVATITLNRPDVRNAFDTTLISDLVAALDVALKDEEVLVAIITGKGKGFCAGQNLTVAKRDKSTSTSDGLYDSFVHPSGYWTRLQSAIHNFTKPLIAAINGAAAGAGFSLAMACDFKIMAEDGYGLLAFINIGLVPDFGASYYLAQTVGYTIAMDIALSGKPIPASKCLEWNLVNKVVPKDTLLDEAQKYAEFIASKPPFAVKLTKRILQFARNNTLSDCIEYEARLQQLCVVSQDFIEGKQAFLEKRKPKWSGKELSVPRGFYTSKL